jgi:methylaspartate mutase epsilon subunit
LTFYDVVRALTIGRGGRFDRSAGGRLSYRAGGREPRIVAGSRTGLPFLARAQVREPELAPRPVVLTDEQVARLRERARAERGTPKLDFAAEVEPLLWAEVEHAYYRCALRLRDGEAAARQFTSVFGGIVDAAAGIDVRRTDEVLAAYGLRGVPPLRADLLAQPFAGSTFADPAAFRARLRTVLAHDVEDSLRGPEGSPRKAALEMLRTLRPALPAIVDFGGLLPKSHEDFLTRFAPVNFLLSAGPPAEHVEQLVALMDAGLVDVVGPQAGYSCGDGCFAAESPVVAGSRREAQVLLDARAPAPDLRHERDPLLRQLLADGLISEYVNTDPGTGDSFATGGLAVTGAPFHVVGASGEPDPDLYALGVATQNTRWFTQVGTGRPGQDSPFRRDADAIAEDVLRPEAA